MYFIYTDVESQLGERFWTGEYTRTQAPSTTNKLADALEFVSARQAYDFAGINVRQCRALLSFRVGRRPNPVNLRSLVN